MATLTRYGVTFVAIPKNKGCEWVGPDGTKVTAGVRKFVARRKNGTVATSESLNELLHSECARIATA